MATYKQILDEVTRKPGDTWKTASGNWYGMKQGEKGEKNPTQSYGPEGQKKAKVYATGGDPDKEDDSEKDKEEPKSFDTGDYERDFDDSEPEDKPFGGDTGRDADSETGKDYTRKFMGTDDDEDEWEESIIPQLKKEFKQYGFTKKVKNWR